MEIRVNESLVNINGLNVLNSIGDYLWIVGNDSLVNLIGLEGLTSISGYLEIGYNASLPDLTGLNNIASVVGYLEVRDNDILINLNGLDNLVSIGDNMRIRNNPVLNSLMALENLTTLGGEFRVSGNTVLVTLEGLHNINAASISDLYLHDNFSLTTCEVESVCDYLSAPNGAIYITNNATGCNDQEEVEDACFTDVQELGSPDHFSILPNPVSDFITIRITNVEQGMMILDLFEISGVKIKALVNEMKTLGTHEIDFDLSDLPKGVYFCVLKTNEGILVKKIIRL